MPSSRCACRTPALSSTHPVAPAARQPAPGHGCCLGSALEEGRCGSSGERLLQRPRRGGSAGSAAVQGLPLARRGFPHRAAGDDRRIFPPLRLPAAGADPATAGPARAVQAVEGAVAQRIGSKAVSASSGSVAAPAAPSLPLANARAFGKTCRCTSTCSPRRPWTAAIPDRLTETLTFDRTLLLHWHPTGRPQGLAARQSCEGHCRAGAGRAAAAARAGYPAPARAPWCWWERTPPFPEVVMSPGWRSWEELASQVVRVQQSLKGQRNLFDRHQPHLFVGGTTGCARWRTASSC